MSLKVTPILGVVTVSEGGDLAEGARPANNNTRWLFDVEGDVEGGVELVVQLVDMRTKRPFNPDIAGCKFLATSSGFYEAQPYELERVGGSIRIAHGGKATCRYRVEVDTMATATR